jgi:hypothetical protein
MHNHLKKRREIHRKREKHAPKAVQKSKKIFKFKYPKLLLFTISILIAYHLFTKQPVIEAITKLGSLNYAGSFFFGILISFGFSTPFAIGYFLISHPENIFLMAICGGIGATIGDLFIFKIIKFSFMKEFKQIERAGLIQKIKKIVSKNKSHLVRHYLIYIFVGFVIASPLPDEIGISILAGLTTIKPRKLAIATFILHTTFILCLLAFGKVIF